MVNTARIEAGKSKEPLFWYIVAFTFYAVVGTVIYFARLYVVKRKDFYQTEVIKREAELNQLKAQLNPHFLFNALNNIYSYNLENNKHGNDLILKLGQLMRFILESSSKTHIPLIDEITFIDHYLSFEEERLGYRCDISYRKEIVTKDIMIPPLVLFPFVENAFKHGSDTINKTAIQIEVYGTQREITLSVENEIVAKKVKSTKTGLSNIERRLELLLPNKHALGISKIDGKYKVKLRIELQ